MGTGQIFYGTGQCLKVHRLVQYSQSPHFLEMLFDFRGAERTHRDRGYRGKLCAHVSQEFDAVHFGHS